jgi:hypothetical protein
MLYAFIIFCEEVQDKDNHHFHYPLTQVLSSLYFSPGFGKYGFKYVKSRAFNSSENRGKNNPTLLTGFYG